MKKEDASLWVGSLSMPCAGLTQGEPPAKKKIAPWRRFRFRVALPAAMVRRDARIVGATRPFTAMFFASIPAGYRVSGLQVIAETPRDIVTSFQLGRTLSAAIEGLSDATEVEVVMRLDPGAPGPRRASGAPAAEQEQAARLRRFGHAFLLAQRRLPALSEVASGLDLALDEAERLAARTHAPLCEEDATRGALPRLVIAGEPSSVLAHLSPREQKVLRLRFGINDKGEQVLEEVGHDFMVTRERIRPIEARALRKLRHPSRSKKLKAFLGEE